MLSTSSYSHADPFSFALMFLSYLRILRKWALMSQFKIIFLRAISAARHLIMWIQMMWVGGGRAQNVSSLQQPVTSFRAGAGTCTWTLPGEETVQGSQGNTQPHSGMANKISTSLCLSPEVPGTCKPVSLLWQGKHSDLRAGKPALGGLWDEKVEAQEGCVDLCHHTQGASIQCGERFNRCVCKAQ